MLHGSIIKGRLYISHVSFFSGQVKDPAWATCLPHLCLWASSVAFKRSVSTDAGGINVATAAVRASACMDGRNMCVATVTAQVSVHTDAKGISVASAAVQAFVSTDGRSLYVVTVAEHASAHTDG
jgi:hypothetical protein